MIKAAAAAGMLDEEARHARVAHRDRARRREHRAHVLREERWRVVSGR
jgi:hypothetical protein